MSSIGQLTQTQNGFDLIAPAANSFGRIAGGVIGGAIAAIFTEGLGCSCRCWYWCKYWWWFR
jgi:O-acetyl-ADP-ribose deacetylase (regulator of RNase III)